MSRLGRNFRRASAQVPTLLQRAIAVLRKFGTDAHVYLPGVGQLNGLTAANYLDSAGTTAGSVDQPVGLVLDALGGLGVELVTNGDFSNGVVNWVDSAPGHWAVVGGRAYHVFSSLYKELGQTFTKKPAGPSYKISVSYEVVSGSAQFFYQNAAGTVQVVVFSGSSGVVGRVITDGIQKIGFSRASSGGEFYIDNISVREVTGIHASQPTTASKPVLRRGAVNLALQSATPATQSITCAATPHTLAIIGTGSVVITGTGSGTLAGTGEADLVTLGFTPTTGSATFTVSGSVTRIALFQGTYTAAQIQALGGIPLTTTAPASTALGSQYWQFDGSNDSLALLSVPFQMADDHWVVGVFSNTSATGDRYIFDVGNSASSSAMVASLALNNTTAKCYWRDDALVTTVLAGGTIPLGTTAVLSARKIGSAVVLRVNGVVVATGTVTAGATTLTGASIGTRVFPANFLAGNANLVKCGKGIITDAQLALIEKLAASAAGIVL